MQRFAQFFGDLEQGFVNELVVNLFARTFRPDEVIIEAGRVVTKIMFITKGQIAICEPSHDKEPFLII